MRALQLSRTRGQDSLAVEEGARMEALLEVTGGALVPIQRRMYDAARERARKALTTQA